MKSSMQDCLNGKSIISIREQFFYAIQNSLVKTGKIGSLLTAIFLLITGLFLTTIAKAQSPVDACRSGCTSKDVVVTSAYLSDINGNPLQTFVCGVDVAYLSLNLATKTPRVGVSIYTDINEYNPTTQTAGDKIDDVGQCFGIALSTATNIVTFTTPIEWDCSGPIALTNTYVAWGTGNTDFCAGTTGFKCGGTPSKCNQLPQGQLIVIQVPQTGNAAAEKCSSTAGSFAATFNLNDLKADIISSPDNYNFSFYTDNDYEAGDLIADPANFSCTAASTTVYAKVCDKNNASACSTADVVLTVYEKPSLPAFTITQPTLCGTATASVNFCNTITGFSYKVGSTDAIDGNDAAQSVSGLVAGSAPSIVVTNKTTGGITAGCPSASFTCSQAVTTCPEASARMRTGSYATEQQIIVEEPAKVTAYPNPFSNKVKFVVTSAIAGQGSLEVYNMLGQKIKSVYQGQIIAGNQTFELSLSSAQRSNLIYVLKVGDRRVTGKLLHLNQ
jgi:hypothetical protein